MSGPVFGKPSRRSKEHKDNSSYASNAPFESTTEAAAPPNKRSSLRTSAATDAHLRIVSLQIGEREAVHAMKDLCEECSASFGVSAKVEEVVDALSGVLVVGDLLRRLGREKSHLEQTLARRTREHDVTLGHQHELMEQMEAMIARLQAEASQAADRQQEAAVRHTHRVTLLNKEVPPVVCPAALYTSNASVACGRCKTCATNWRRCATRTSDCARSSTRSRRR